MNTNALLRNISKHINLTPEEEELLLSKVVLQKSAPPRFLTREGQTTAERLIGHQLGLKYEFEIDRHLRYFLAGKFLEMTRQAKKHFSSGTNAQL